MKVRDAQMDFDVAIVGGGPAGLSAALVLGRCLRKVVLFDDQNPRNAAADAMHGFLTREGISPWDLRRIARDELAPFDVTLRDECVVDAHKRDGGFSLLLASGAMVTACKLVLATGMRDVVPELVGIETLLGKSAHACPYCHGWEERGGALAGYATGAGAAEFALGLTTWSSDVILFTEGRVELSRDECAALARNEVRIEPRHILRLDSNAPGRLSRVVLTDGEHINRSALFFHNGQVQRSELPGRLGVVFEPNRTVATGTCERTNVPGLWVVGDASHDVEFAIVAAAEGAKAAYAINMELRTERCG